MSEPHRNPVHKHEGKWWHWDELWTNRLGPHDTAEDAQTAHVDYCIELNKQNPENPPYPLLERWKPND